MRRCTDAARTIDTRLVRDRLQRFEQAHRSYVGAQRKVDAAESQIRAVQARRAQLETIGDDAIGQPACTLVAAGVSSRPRVRRPLPARAGSTPGAFNANVAMMNAIRSRSLRVLAALSVASGCTAMRPEEATILINWRPMVIGFAPPVSRSALDQDPGLHSAFDDWERGLENTAACLASSGVQVRAVYADTVLLVLSEERNVAVKVHPSRGPRGMGAYVYDPQHPRLMYLEAPGAFVDSLPGAAADAFHVAGCCSETARARKLCSQH